MRKLLLLFLLWGGCVSSFAQVNAYSDRARLQDFARQLTGGIDRLGQQMDAFSARTGLDIYIVTAYKYNQPDISRLAAEWPAKGKGLLLGLNLHEAGNWSQNLRIAYSPDVTAKIPAEKIEQVRTLVLLPLLEDREISVPDGFGGTTKVSFGGQGKYYLTLEQGIAALLAAFEGTPLGAVPAIAFSPAPNALRGFDAKRHEALAQHYRKGPNEFTGKDEYIPWKAIEAAKTDVVEVVSPGRSNRAELAKVQFNSPTGSVPASRVADDRFQLTLQGAGRAENTQEIRAYYPTGGNSGYTMARLNVVTYNKLPKNLVIVPLTGTDGVPTGEDVRRVLNQIYGQAVAEWSVAVAPAFDPGAWDGNGNGQVEIGNSGLLSNYTAEMRAINRTFRNNTPAYNRDTYYLFLVNQSENAATLGYMPRAKQFGYIFTQAVMRAGQSVSQVIAHELGHGAFHLKHTFDETSVARGTSDNLMDYGNGTRLHKYQWDLVHDPVRVIGLLEEDEEGVMVAINGAKLAVQICDSIVRDQKLYYMSNNNCKLYVTLESKDTTIKSVLVNLAVAVTDSQAKISRAYTISAFNTKQQLEIDSLPEGRYVISTTVGEQKLSKAFYFRKKKHDYACSVCGRDLNITFARLQKVFKGNSKLTQQDAMWFTDALQKTGFNTCKKQAHFFSQTKIETDNFLKFVESTNYRPSVFLKTFKENCNLKNFYNQSFWTTKNYKDYFHFKVYEFDTTSTNPKFKPTEFITYKWSPGNKESYCKGVVKEAKDTIRVPIEDKLIKDVKGQYSWVKYNDVQKEEIQIRLMSITYAKKLGNGDSTTRDGYVYRGRGAVHLTGRESYREVSKTANRIFKTTFDWETNYDELEKNKQAIIYSGASYFVWKLSNLDFLQKNNSASVSLKVNGGDNKLVERGAEFNKMSETNLFDCIITK